MRAIFSGSRDWQKEEPVRSALVSLKRRNVDVTIVQGECEGLDLMVDRIARELGLKVEGYPADWKTHGKAAGGIRNQDMVDLGADIAFAFPLPTSRGTWDFIRRAKEAGIPVLQYWDGRFRFV